MKSRDRSQSHCRLIDDHSPPFTQPGPMLALWPSCLLRGRHSVDLALVVVVVVVVCFFVVFVVVVTICICFDTFCVLACHVCCQNC